MSIRFSHSSILRSGGLVLASACALLLAGCAFGVSAPEQLTEMDGPAFQGNVHGGQYPVAGATVRIWAVGNSGYGSTLATPAIGGTTTPSLLATTVTDAGGNFSFGSSANGVPYTCPASAPLIYLTAQGGDSGGTGDGLADDPNANSAIGLMSTLSVPTVNTSPTSVCSTVKLGHPTIQMNEVTTIASMYALAQFYNPVTETSTGVPAIGAPTGNALGLAAAFNLVPNLVNLGSGTANVSYQPYGFANGLTIHNQVTVMPEYQKINLLANILAACINTGSSNSLPCTRLFADAVPPPVAATTTLGAGTVFPVAKDTLTAAYYLAVNPINATTAGVTNTTAMTELNDLVPPTAPFQPQAVQPTDWTLAATYSSTALSGSAYWITSPSNIQVDATGLVWFSNQPPTPTGTNPTSITDLNTWGGAQANAFPSRSPTQGLAISMDATPSEYVAGVSATVPSVYKVSPNAENEFTNSGGIQATAFAHNGTTATGSLFFVQPTTGYLFETLSRSITGGLIASPVQIAVTPLNDGHSVNIAPTSNIALDPNSNAWIPSGATGNNVTQITFGGANVSTTPAVIGSGLYKPNQVAVDHANNIWVTNAAGSTPANGYLAYIPTTAGVAGAPIADLVNGDGGINNPFGLSIDGAGNVWVANEGQSGSGQSVSEFSLVAGAITPMSPLSTGFAHTFNGPTTLAVDPSGNVWIANTSSTATTGNGGMITQIIGAAVPVVTPLAKGVANNTLGTKPQ